MEHFVLYPDQDLYVLPYASIPFDLHSVRVGNSGTQYTKISLPNENYKWTLSDKSIGSLTARGVMKCNDKLGTTQVTIEDRRGSENRVDTSVTVVEPWSINMLVRECKDGACREERLPRFLRRNKEEFKYSAYFNLIYGKTYIIKAFIYDRLNNMVAVSDNAEIKWNLPSELTILENRGGEVLVKASTLFDPRYGSTELTRVKSGSSVYRVQGDISVSKEISVNLPLKIIKPAGVVRLPLNEQPTAQSLRLMALGGSSNYDWYSSDNTVAVVNIDGVITAKASGETVIYVADKTNPDNVDEVKIVVSHISQILFVENLKEIPVGEKSNSLVYITDANGNRFTSCHTIKFGLEDQNKFSASSVQKEFNNEQELIDFIREDIQGDDYYRQLVEGESSYQESASDYSDYLKETGAQRGTTSLSLLRSILDSQKSFGICGVITTEALREGDNLLKITINERRGQSQRQKLLDQLKTTSPVTDSSHFLADEYLLTHLSSLKWAIRGGARKWENIQNNPVSTFSTNVRSQTEEVLEFYTIEKGYNTRKVFVACNNPGSQVQRVVLTMNIFNERSTSLPRPVMMKKAITVKCGHPSSIRIYKIGKNQSYLSPSSFKAHGDIPNNIIVDTSYRLQAWAFDENLKPYFNFSSLDINWSGADASKGVILNKTTHQVDNGWYEDEQQILSLDGQILSGVGRIDITASADKFEEQREYETFRAIQDTITFKILDTIILQPSVKLLLLHPDSAGNVYVQGGSGMFEIKLNDSSIVDYTYDDASRTLRFVPKQRGAVLVTVLDMSQEVVVKTQGIVKVASPVRTRLELTEDLVESGAPVRASVQVMDMEGNLFDEDQLRLISFSLQPEYTSFAKDSNLKVNIVEREHNQFEIVADFNKAGLENVPLIATAKGQFDPLDENMEYSLVARNTFMVYSRLETFPSQINSSPGCTFTISVLFSKLQHERYSFSLEFEPQDTTLLRVIKQGDNQVTYEALSQGTTYIIATLSEISTKKLLTSSKIPVRINMVTGLRILKSQDRRVHTNAPIRMVASPIIGDDPITPSFCQFQYKWETSYTNIVQVSPAEVIKTFDDSETTPYNTHFALNITGLKPGTAEISLTLTTASSSSLESSNSVTATTMVRFIDSVNSRFNVYLGKEFSGLQSELMILPINAGYKVSANRNMYNLGLTSPCGALNNLLNVQDNGFINTYDMKGIGTLKLTEKSEPDNFRLVNILVTDVYALVAENSYMAGLVSQGGKVVLKLTLQDEFGRVFPSPLFGYDFTAIATHGSIVSLEVDQETQSLIIRGLNKGETLVYVHLAQNPNIFDVFKVRVGSLVTPVSPVKVHVGGTVKFKIGGEVKRSKNRVWNNLDKNVLKVDSYSGESQALEEGTDTVVYDDGVHIESVVEVIKVDRIAIEHHYGARLSNIPQTGESWRQKEVETSFLGDENIASSVIQHSIRLSFYHGSQQIMRLLNQETDEIQNKLKVDCKVSEPNWFESKLLVSTDPTTGSEDVRCILRPKSVYPSASYFPSEIVLTVELHSTNNDFSISESTAIDYEWAFKLSDRTTQLLSGNVNPTHLTPKTLDLSQDRASEIITIVTPRELSFTTTDKFPESFITSSYVRTLPT